jgi:hypothetical protein
MNWLALVLDVALLATLIWATCRRVRANAVLGCVVADCLVYVVVIVLIFFGYLLQQVAGFLWFDTFGDHRIYEHSVLGFSSMVLDAADGVDPTFLPPIAFSALSVLLPLLLARMGWEWLRKRWMQVLCGTVAFVVTQSCVDWVQVALGWNWFMRPYLWQSYVGNLCGAPFLSIIATWFYYRVTPRLAAGFTPSRKLLFRRCVSILVGVGIVVFLIAYPISEPFELTCSIPRFARLHHAIVTPVLSQMLKTKRIHELSGTAYSPLRIGSVFAPVHLSPMSIAVSRDRSLSLDPANANMLDRLFSTEQESAPIRVDGGGFLVSFGQNPSSQNIQFDALSVMWADLVIRQLEEATDVGPEHPEVYRVHVRFATPGTLMASSQKGIPLKFGLIQMWRQYDAHPILGKVATMFGIPDTPAITFSEDGHDPPLYVSKEPTAFELSVLLNPPLPNSIEFNSLNALDFDVHGPLTKSDFSGGYAFADEIEVVVSDGVIRRLSTDETLRDGDRILVRGEAPLLIEVKNSGALKITGSFKALSVRGEEIGNTPWDRADGYVRTGIVGIFGLVVASLWRWMWGTPTVKKPRN